MSDKIHVINATVDPPSAPVYTGQHWVNTATNQTWLSVGTAVISDWLLVGGSGVSWALTGNAGTNPSTNFIGTTNLQGFSVRTAGIEAIRVTPTQQVGIGTATPVLHFEVKSHSSANASGLSESTYYVETTSSALQNSISITLPDPCVMSFEYTAVARAADGSSRATFKRSGLLYRESSSVQVQGAWQSDLTIKSNNSYNVGYSISTGTITFKIQAPTSSTVRWTGYLKVQQIY